MKIWIVACVVAASAVTGGIAAMRALTTAAQAGGWDDR
jgi:hypothetical protein